MVLVPRFSRTLEAFIFRVLTLGDRIITKPSSAGLSSIVWISLEEVGGFIIANDSEETDPFEAGSSAVVLALTGTGLGIGAVLIFPVKSLNKCNWNPPSW